MECGLFVDSTGATPRARRDSRHDYFVPWARARAPTSRSGRAEGGSPFARPTRTPCGGSASGSLRRLHRSSNGRPSAANATRRIHLVRKRPPRGSAGTTRPWAGTPRRGAAALLRWSMRERREAGTAALIRSRGRARRRLLPASDWRASLWRARSGHDAGSVPKAWPREIRSVLAADFSPRIGRSRALSRPWSASTLLLAYRPASWRAAGSSSWKTLG
jgi:hypothetical protein